MAFPLRKLLLASGMLTVLALPPAQAVTPDELFEVLQRIESLENEVRYLRGENEQLRFDMEDIKNTQKRTFIRIDDRMDDLFRAVNTRKVSSAAAIAPTVAAPTPAGAPKNTKLPPLKLPVQVAKPVVTKPVTVKKPVQAATASPVVLPSGVKQSTQVVNELLAKATPAEQQAYDSAFANIRVKPSAAISLFRQFLKQYPGSALAPNAQYWLGEVMFTSRNYKGAINEFVTVLESYADSERAPDAAVKLSLSFYEMKNWLFARRSLQNVVRFYPKTPAADFAKARLAKMQQDNLF